MNIGILGGSFDPIHNGHLHMAKCAYESYALDQVWLIPAGHSPNKDEHGMTDAKDRFQMCKLAAQPYPWMTVSRLELDSAERSYTYRTMEKLSEQFPMHRFFFIMETTGTNCQTGYHSGDPEGSFYHRCTGEEDPFVAGTISL